MAYIKSSGSSSLELSLSRAANLNLSNVWLGSISQSVGMKSALCFHQTFTAMLRSYDRTWWYLMRQCECILVYHPFKIRLKKALLNHYESPIYSKLVTFNPDQFSAINRLFLMLIKNEPWIKNSGNLGLRLMVTLYFFGLPYWKISGKKASSSKLKQMFPLGWNGNTVFSPISSGIFD